MRITCEDCDMGSADIHCHTIHSGFTKITFLPFPESVTPPQTMVDTASAAGLDILCITDHNTIRGAQIARAYAAGADLTLDVVIGEEVTTSDGELLGLFLEEHVPPDLSAAETIDIIHSQGGLAIAPHPFSYQCPSLGRAISGLRLDGIEVLNAGHRDNYVNKIASEHCLGGIARLGSSDAHTHITLGNAFTVFDGHDQEDLYKAIKQGRTTVSGSANTLVDYIGWSVEVANGVSRKLLTPEEEWEPDDPLGQINRMRKHNKLLALAGTSLYSTTPLPFLCAAMGEGLVRYRGHKKWVEVMGSDGGFIFASIANSWRRFLLR